MLLKVEDEDSSSFFNVLQNLCEFSVLICEWKREKTVTVSEIFLGNVQNEKVVDPLTDELAYL
jgi:hypothetical protein